MEARRTHIDGCSATRAVGDQSPPLVVCARHKAIAVDAELTCLAGNEEAVLAQLEAARDAAIAAGRPQEEVIPLFEARVADVRAAAVTKRVALQTAAVAADAALEGALAAVAALTEAAVRLDDAELAAQAPALLALEAAARAAVAAIPVTPLTGGFLGLTTSPTFPDVLPDALFGRVLLAPIMTPHVHTPHCEPACAIRFAPHTHSAGCNHVQVGEGAVFDAAAKGDVAALEAALAAGGSTEEAHPESLAPLSYSADAGRVAAVQVLLAAGADPMATSTDGTNSLHRAAHNGHAAVVSLLLADPRVNPNVPDVFDSWTPLHEAAHGGHAAVVSLLLAHPMIVPDVKEKFGFTPLHIAARCGHAHVIHTLLADERVDPNALELSKSRTPLHRAASYGSRSAVETLLSDPRVNVNAQDEDGLTPLCMMARRGHKCIEALLAHPRVDPSLCNRHKWTPLHWAALYRHAAVVRILIADPRVDQAPRTLCVEWSRTLVSRCQDSHSGPPSPRQSGATALDIAVGGGATDVVTLLRGDAGGSGGAGGSSDPAADAKPELESADA